MDHDSRPHQQPQNQETFDDLRFELKETLRTLLSLQRITNDSVRALELSLKTLEQPSQAGWYIQRTSPHFIKLETSLDRTQIRSPTFETLIGVAATHSSNEEGMKQTVVLELKKRLQEFKKRSQHTKEYLEAIENDSDAQYAHDFVYEPQKLGQVSPEVLITLTNLLIKASSQLNGR